MCGIVGFSNLRRAELDSDSIIRRMAAMLRHRGPDDEGFYSDGKVALGHRRLSIIDISGGRQPRSSGDGRFHIIYNGEIYNYVELREELKRRRCRFVSDSDTEVVLQQYSLDGLDSLKLLNGMFAFAIWDSQDEQLVLARDRIGIKPLYYCLRDGELIFASELKALLAHHAVDRRLSLPSLSKYFSYGYVPTPATIFDGIYKLEAGTALTFDRKGIRKHLYWDVPLNDDPASDLTIEESAEDLLEVLRDSVAIHLRSDVPVGVFLSGGLDSSTIAALARQTSSEQLHTFSMGFDEMSFDETRHAERVASYLGTRHHVEVLTLKRATEIFPRITELLDEPLADASAIPTYALSEFAHSHVKVVLGGDGGDELFAGYPSFQAHKLIRNLSFLPLSFRDALRRLARHLPVSHRYASYEFLFHQFLKGLGLSAEIRFLLWMGFYSNTDKRRLFTPQLRRQLLRHNSFEDVTQYIRQSGLKGDLPRLQYLLLKMYLPDDVLTKVDRVAMSNSLEVRVPFLDNSVVDYSCRINPKYILRGFTTKYVLKRAVKALLPEEIIHRRKSGFMMPVARWISKELRPLTEELCSATAIQETGLFEPAVVAQMLREHFDGKRDHRKEIYPLLCFMAWRSHYGGTISW